MCPVRVACVALATWAPVIGLGFAASHQTDDLSFGKLQQYIDDAGQATRTKELLLFLQVLPQKQRQNFCDQNIGRLAQPVQQLSSAFSEFKIQERNASIIKSLSDESAHVNETKALTLRPPVEFDQRLSPEDAAVAKSVVSQMHLKFSQKKIYVMAKAVGALLLIIVAFIVGPIIHEYFFEEIITEKHQKKFKSLAAAAKGKTANAFIIERKNVEKANFTADTTKLQPKSTRKNIAKPVATANTQRNDIFKSTDSIDIPHSSIFSTVEASVDPQTGLVIDVLSETANTVDSFDTLPTREEPLHDISAF